MAKTALKGVPSVAAGRAIECALADLKPYAAMVSHFGHIAKHGVSLDDVKRPAYFRNHWRTLSASRWSMITVIAEDGTWEAVFRVVDAGDGFVRTRLLSQFDATQQTDDLPKGWEVTFVDSGWRVRNEEGLVVTFGHRLKDLAVEAALDMVRRLR